ncbi:MAG: Serine-aspartate repeat-containing protein D, partial [Candidatus Ordinivivax streblomastigis]
MRTSKIISIEKTAKAAVSIFAWSIFALTFGCSSDLAEEEITPTYSIGGTVTKSDGGVASGASVQLQSAADDSNLEQTTTDATGAYAFTGLTVGAYKVVVTLNGYETATIGDIELKSNTSGKDALLQKFVEPTYAISGVATLFDGSAAASVSVQIRKTSDNTNVGQAATTDASGAYLISDIPAGAYSIIFTL